MSYIHSLALQSAIYDHLNTSGAVTAIVGNDIYDAIPPGDLPDLFVLIGEERVVDRSDKLAHAARHDVTISVFSTAHGFSQGKALASEISNALKGAALNLSAGNLRNLQFRTARSRRDTGDTERRIDLIFRAFIDEQTIF